MSTPPSEHSSTPTLGPWRAGEVEGFTPFPDAAVAGSLGERFADVAQRHAERLAVRSPAGGWTYGELRDQLRRWGGGITERLGSGSGRPVAVLATHDGPLVAAIMAVISAGEMVVVLDPMAPPGQIQHMVDESRSTILLHDDAQAEVARELAAAAPHGCTAVPFDELDGAPIDAAASGPRAPAMLAFTSGTSGSPKGAVITHGLLLNLVRGATNALGIGPDDRMPMLFPTSMAVAAYPMFLPLLNGGTLSTLDVRSEGFAPIGPFLRDERITLAYLAPTVVRFLVDALGGLTFPDLRMVALGGEGIDPDAVALTRKLFAPDRVGIGYGTTETGVVCLGVLPEGGPALDEVPCGYAVPDVELFVLGDDGEILPDGEPGEIAVAGPHLFDGYQGHPELDAQVLAPDPRGRDGWQLYRTGDHGKIDPNGALVVLGRIDTKVKVRGRFVVLGDVEAALHALDEVEAAAVVAVRHEGITELVAYVVAAGEGITGPDLRATLLETSETYRVPTRWVFLDELPRLPNGKTDRRALPPVDLGPTPAGGPPGVAPGAAAEPADGLEREIAGIWETLLPVPTVDLDADFADLGGDSLLAAQMLVWLEQRLGVTVPMGELVHARTVRSLAAVVRRLRAVEGEPSTAACVQEGDEGRPRLWFVHDLQGSAYRVRHLAAALGEDQPVWSFESPLLRGEANRFSMLETFAANYLTDLRAAQPEGPYWLGGYSFGGICAYEMARQLRRDGHEVAFVGVVDVGPGYRGPGWHARRSPFRPWFGVAKPPEAGSPLRDQLEHYREMARSGPGRLARHLMVRSGLSRVVDPIRFRNDLRTHGRVRPAWRLWYAWEEHWKLAATEWDRANTYDGDVDLFWASETPSADATLGWGPLVADLRIHRFEGDHLGTLEPSGAAALAEVLREVLDERVAQRD